MNTTINSTTFSTINTDWNVNQFYKLNKEAEAAKIELEQLNKKIKQIAQSGNLIKDSLANSFNRAINNVKKYQQELEEALKDQNKIKDSAKNFKGFDPNIVIQNMGFTKDFSQRLLNDVSRTKFMTESRFNQTNIAATSSGIATSNQRLENLARLETAQMGIDLVRTVSTSIKQGFMEANSIAASIFKSMAEKYIQKGDWMSAKNSLTEAWNKEKQNMVMDTAESAFDAGMTTFMTTKNPWLAIAALGGTFAVSGSKRYDALKDQYNYEVKSKRDAIVDSSNNVMPENIRLEKTRYQESLLEDPEANLEIIKAEYEKHKAASDKLFEDSMEMAGMIQGFQVRNEKHGLTDRETQEFMDLHKKYNETMEAQAENDRMAKSYGSAIKSTEASIKAREEAAQLEKEREEAAKSEAYKNLNNYRTLAKEQNVRTEYAEELAGFMEAYGDKEGLEFFNQQSRDQKINLENSIKDQMAREEALNKEIEALNKKQEDGSITSDELKKQLELEKELADTTKQRKEDEKLLNNEELQKEIQDSANEKYKNSLQRAESSKYLSENLGSFSRYFGKTDPSLNLMKESNNLLKGILNAVNSSNSRYETTSYQ